jgi:hypothetical protein
MLLDIIEATPLWLLNPNFKSTNRFYFYTFFEKNKHFKREVYCFWLRYYCMTINLTVFFSAVITCIKNIPLKLETSITLLFASICVVKTIFPTVL